MSVRAAIIIWYGLIATFLGSLATAICNWRWYLRGEGGNEAYYVGVSSSIIAILALGGIIIQYCCDEHLQQKRQTAKERAKTDRKTLCDRIKKERSNLEHIRDKKPYSKSNGDAHRRAVEDVSLELIGDALESMQAYWRYRKVSTQALAEIQHIKAMAPRQKDVSRLLPVLDVIEARLRKDGIS